ncbi:MAG: glycosyltransferase 87 family protein [Anaerolineae bacterium]|jgi:hypothetical protein|nr:glycosyltransferase 87 family protein [Anaerolineae bacterium]
MQALLTRPLKTPRQFGVVLVILLALGLAPSVTPTDWELNTADLGRGLAIYENPSYVYPPWALILLLPYQAIGVVGAKIASGAVVAALAWRRRWTLGQLLAVIVSPFFVFAIMFSNLDLLVLTLPILLWEWAADRRWGWSLRGFGLALLLIKPQGAFLIIPYLLWRDRKQWRALLPAIGLTFALTVPISLIGSPPLFLQWIDNIRTPSEANQVYWLINNVSMSAQIGIPLAAIVLTIVLGGVAWRIRHRWQEDHRYAILLLGAILLSPYASTQSMIAATAFVPSWIAVIAQYGLTLLAGALGLYNQFVSAWMLLFGVIALLLANRR